MAHSFTRQELYDLVWSEPMKNIAVRFEISDVGLAKACRNASIPVPPRGYWAKKQAGHKTAQIPLPPREPGHPNSVTIGRDRNWYHQPEPIDENEPDPPPPTFDEPIEEVCARIERRTGAVPVPKALGNVHPAVRKLIEKDEQLREKQKQYGWYSPIFDTPVQRRRLRILNALLLAAAKQGFRGSISGDRADEISIGVGHTHLVLELSILPERGRNSAKDDPAPKRERLRLSLQPSNYGGQKATLAEDGADISIEDRLRPLLVDLIVTAEERYREAILQSHKWELERRHSIIERARKERAEAERKERERLAALEKARVDRLTGEARALQLARDIRMYVAEVKSLSPTLDPPVPEAALDAWAKWALAQADRIDPVLSRRFLDNDELKSASEAPGD